MKVRKLVTPNTLMLINAIENAKDQKNAKHNFRALALQLKPTELEMNQAIEVGVRKFAERVYGCLPADPVFK